jgi:GTP pyrophosphokinase/guanosine-3',5'-bis(diphosphate) 3'-pyrophosphohydrolase
MGVLHQLYKPVPGRFKDYIAIPKGNGYQSLHTTLVSPLGTAVEFQIRTEPMHAVAEKGIAAHWLYKEHDDGPGQEAQRLGAMWLQSLLDIQDETRDANEFLEHVKIDLFPDAVYVFTPKSKILALPRGATPVDFAYAIHSDVGDHCVAATVNGEPVPLRTELRSGDVVEIVGAPNARPNPAWLNFVATGRARSRIRHYLKNMELEESRDLGRRCWPGDALRGPRPARRRLRLGHRLAAADSLEWQQDPRGPVHRHRPRPQDRHHRRHPAGAPPGRGRHPSRRAGADDGPLRHRRLGADAEAWC